MQYCFPKGKKKGALIGYLDQRLVEVVLLVASTTSKILYWSVKYGLGVELVDRPE